MPNRRPRPRMVGRVSRATSRAASGASESGGRAEIHVCSGTAVPRVVFQTRQELRSSRGDKDFVRMTEADFEPLFAPFQQATIALCALEHHRGYCGQRGLVNRSSRSCERPTMTCLRKPMGSTHSSRTKRTPSPNSTPMNRTNSPSSKQTSRPTTRTRSRSSIDFSPVAPTSGPWRRSKMPSGVAGQPTFADEDHLTDEFADPSWRPRSSMTTLSPHGLDTTDLTVSNAMCEVKNTRTVAAADCPVVGRRRRAR